MASAKLADPPKTPRHDEKARKGVPQRRRRPAVTARKANTVAISCSSATKIASRSPTFNWSAAFTHPTSGAAYMNMAIPNAKNPSLPYYGRTTMALPE